MIAHILTTLLALVLQFSPSVIWKAAVNHTEGDRYQLVVSGEIAKDYYVHPMSDPNVGTILEVNTTDRVFLAGKPEEEYTPTDYKGEEVVTGAYVLRQALQINGTGKAAVEGTVTWSACSGDFCGMPEDYEFSVPVALPGEAGHDGATKAGNLWGLILEAILWGLLMLLTPCVFPMIPMTVSFFLKSSENPHEGRFKALMYGVFIVLLYTVPICVIIGLTWLLGGDAVTANIFNWLATHWLPNILFFLVFMVFAASFFGAFEITLPSSWQNRSDAGTGKKGLAGIFFMALTLVLVSFSCTGPIVGSVLIRSTRGEFWTPMVTMLAFSVAFALPFTLFALFPSLLKKMRGGSWLNSVKVVLGFIEVAFGFKFLSVADQTYGWGLLDREVYLAIWIVVFTLLGLYLLGKIRFAHDEPVEHIGITRLALSIAVFSFVVYMIPGMFGAPLKALSGYLPPMDTQDFIIANYAEGQGTPVAQAPEGQSSTYDLKIPHGLPGYFTLDEALAAAAAEDKPVFVDITGKGCTNCREMEARVWSDPDILALLRDRFVIAALYTDYRGAEVPEGQWITTPKGKTLKRMDEVNSYLARERFGVNAQPYYFILGRDGQPLTPGRSYNLSIPGFAAFLQEGLAAYER